MPALRWRVLVVGLLVILAVVVITLNASRGRSHPIDDDPVARRRLSVPGGSATAAVAQPLQFSLIDQLGRSATQSLIMGQWSLIYTGYTYCPSICPSELSFVARVVDGVAQRGVTVQPIFISVDPARDSPAVLADYLPRFHSRLLGLTTMPTATAAAWTAIAGLGAVASVDDPHAAGDAYLLTHTISTFLVNPSGIVVARYRSDGGVEPAVADILRRIP